MCVYMGSWYSSSSWIECKYDNFEYLVQDLAQWHLFEHSYEQQISAEGVEFFDCLRNISFFCAACLVNTKSLDKAVIFYFMTIYQYFFRNIEEEVGAGIA
jgi:hypothetical protein